MGRIVVLGSLNVDLVVRVPTLPKPGETVVGERLETFSGGKGANQAVAAARLGGSVSMVGRVGNDAFGEKLEADLRRDGVDTTGLTRDPNLPTGTALILIDPTGQNVIAVASGANAAVDESEVAHALDLLDDDSVLVMQFEIPHATVRSAVLGAQQKGHRVLLNAAPASPLDPDMVSGIDTLVVNEIEGSYLIGRQIEGLEGARRVLQSPIVRGVRLRVVTLGNGGAAFVEDGQFHHVPGFPTRVVDTTAAGDAFVGALAVTLTAGAEGEEAIRFANAAGAAAVSKLGAQSSLPRSDEIRDRFGVALP